MLSTALVQFTSDHAAQMDGCHRRASLELAVLVGAAGLVNDERLFLREPYELKRATGRAVQPSLGCASGVLGPRVLTSTRPEPVICTRPREETWSPCMNTARITAHIVCQSRPHVGEAASIAIGQSCVMSGGKHRRCAW
jgi:hypothetical protein